MVLKFSGASLSVLASALPSEVQMLLDGKFVNVPNGSVESVGAHVNRFRLFSLLEEQANDTHVLELNAKQGVKLYAFSFD